MFLLLLYHVPSLSLSKPPPAYYRIYPQAIINNPPTTVNADAAPAPAPLASQPKTNLISRFHLEERVNDSSQSSSAIEVSRKWEDDVTKREASLKERKAKMVLAARE
jgi:hypothetical protein